MDRNQALTTADEMGKKYNLGPQGHRTAVMFHTDTFTKTFVELEAGGKDALTTMMEKNLFMPYTWKVRHFQEFEKNEVVFNFTPDGRAYSFKETLSENTPGNNISTHAAQEIAETSAHNYWHIDFTNYRLVETSEKTQLSLRIDHTFEYERTDYTVGEGFYRLRIIVSGDKVTEVSSYIKIPETFTRRYGEMRSANTTIASFAQSAMLLLYIFIGCGLGLYYMMRKKWLLWKQALRWGIFISAAITLASINQLPFLWMYYQNALSVQTYFMQLLLNFFLSFCTQTCFITIVIMTAESLTRYAFGEHPQLWSLWISRNSSSYSVLGRTFGAYLLVGINCAFVIAFYHVSTRYWGWWIPSEMLFDPNILATYLPWFGPLAHSLQAGFLEECLFRAIPLAGAAIIGKRYGKKNIWVGAAFIIQAIVFGAAHANYPTQPAYGRIIELLLPSFIWGAVYLRFGLLTTIITHTVYDIIWFSLSLFISTAPYALLYKIIIVVCALLPLLLVLYARSRHGSWLSLDNIYRNASWQSADKESHQPDEQNTTSDNTTYSPAHTYTHISTIRMLFFGITSICIWIYFTPFTHNGRVVTQTRTEAVQEAQELLNRKNISLSSLKTLPLFFHDYRLIPALHMQHAFIWQKGSPELYQELLNTYLQPTHWTVRYAQFEGDLTTRAEEYYIFLYDQERFLHVLPESTPGVSLSKDEARALAHTHISTHYSIDPLTLTEFSAKEKQLPARKNWFFVFVNPAIDIPDNGQARINVLIAGDSVVDCARIIHVPEEWERTEQNNKQRQSLIQKLFTIVSMIIGLYLGYRYRSTMIDSTLTSKYVFWYIFCGIFCISILDVLNAWPSIIGSFVTYEPWYNQIFQKLMSYFLLACAHATLFGFFITYYLRLKNTYSLPITTSTYIYGVINGISYAAIHSIIYYILPQTIPVLPDYASLTGTIPLLGGITRHLLTYGYIAICYTVLGTFVAKSLNSGTWMRILLFFFVIMQGVMSIAIPSLSSLPLWSICGLINGVVLLLMYMSLFRYNPMLIPSAISGYYSLLLLRQCMFNAYPGARIECISTIIIICIVTMILSRYSSIKKYTQ
jgi:hypothetical protein